MIYDIRHEHGKSKKNLVLFFFRNEACDFSSAKQDGKSHMPVIHDRSQRAKLDPEFVHSCIPLIRSLAPLPASFGSHGSQLPMHHVGTKMSEECTKTAKMVMSPVTPMRIVP